MKLNLTADEVLTTTRQRPQAPRLRQAGRPGDRRGVPRDRPAGADRLEPPGLALGRHRGRRQAARPSPTCTSATSRSTARCPAPSTPTGDSRGERQDKVRDSAGYLSDNFHRAPMLLIPCLWGRLDNASVVQGAGAWGSLLPAVWSFMLALRERGMGSAWTTIHLMNDGEREVAELLGIPYDKVQPGRAVPDRLHDRHRLQAGQARAAGERPALGPVVTSRAVTRSARRLRLPVRLGRRGSRRARPRTSRSS